MNDRREKESSEEGERRERGRQRERERERRCSWWVSIYGQIRMCKSWCRKEDQEDRKRIHVLVPGAGVLRYAPSHPTNAVPTTEGLLQFWSFLRYLWRGGACRN